ncbi:hypothetical protein GGD81_001659 [Rhodobium orientis]|nr:AsmA-like C-terminal region-containing protein [Rhodobium orientis]MBB4302629.1 hypothetical protein [Rhodobium orientis]
MAPRRLQPLTQHTHHVHSAFGILLRVALVLVVVTAIAIGAFAWRVSSGPLTLNIFAEAVRARIAEAVGPDAKVGLSAIVLAWSEDGGPRVRLRGLVIGDTDAGFEAEVPTADVRLNGFQLLVGRVAPRAIRVYSPRVRIPVAGGASASPETLLEFADHAFKGTLAGARSIGLSSIRVEDATVEMRSTDEDGHSRTYSSVAADLGFAHDSRTTTLDVSGIGFGGKWSASAVHRPDLATGGSVLALSGTDITVDDVFGIGDAARTGSATRIPLYPSFAAQYDDVGRLTGAHMKLVVGAGHVPLGGGSPYLLDEAVVDIAWVPDEKVFKIGPSVAEFGATKLPFTGIVVPPRGPDAALWEFGVESRNAEIASPFEGEPATPLDLMVTTGTFDPDLLRVGVTKFQVGAGDTPLIQSTAVVDLGAFGPKLEVDGRLNAVPVRTLKRIWPEFITPPARRWMLDNVISGDTVDGSFRAAVGSEELDDNPETWGWGEDDLTARFTVRDAVVKTFGEMPTARAPLARGEIDGGHLKVEIPGASLKTASGGTVTVQEAVFEIADIRPPKQTASLRLQLSGPTRNVAEVVNAKPIEALAPIGVTPAALGGTVTVKAGASFALLRELSFDDVDYGLTADLADFSSKTPISGRKVTDGTLSVTVAEGVARIDGKARFDGAMATVDLTEPLDGSSGGASKVGITLKLTDAERREQGLDLGGLVSGPIEVSIASDGGGADKYEIDLKDARLVVAPLGWSKEPGVPATARFRISGARKNEVNDLRIEGKDFAITGHVVLDDNGDLKSGELTSARLGRTVIDRAVMRASGADQDIVLTASAIDARAILKGITDVRGKGEGADLEGDFRIRGKIGMLIGFNAANFSGVDLDVTVAGGSLKALRLTGSSGKRGRLDLTLKPEGARRALYVESDNVGDFLRFLNIYKRMQGGSGEITASLGDGTASNGRFRISDFRVTEDPALKQLVARGNFEDRLRGDRPVNIRPIAESGDTVFEKLDVKFRLESNRMVITDALLKGAVIGGTMKGTVDFRNKRMAIAGTMVPAYGINNLFGRVPLLGQALGGGRNGGLIGVTFKIDGPVGDTKMTVNPMSVVAPGIFRKIFEY